MIHNFNSTNYIFLLLLCLAALAIFETPNDSFAEYGCVSIQTDKSSYTTNEVIFVSGTVINCSFFNTRDYAAPVTIQVFDPDENIIHVDQIETGDLGDDYSLPYQQADFYTSINTGGSLWQKSGQYRIYAQYGDSYTNGETFFTIGASTYAIVASLDDDGVQIIDISNPANIVAKDAETDGANVFTTLAGAHGVATFTIGSSTFAIVTSYFDDVVQIIDITDPSNIVAKDAETDGANGFTKLEGALGVATFTIGSSTFAIVTSLDDDGVQIIDISNPANIVAKDAETDGANGFTKLEGALGVATFTISGSTYAIVASNSDDGVQIIDISNPANIVAKDAETDGANGFTKLRGAVGVATFTIGGISPPPPTTSVMILRGSSEPGCDATYSCFDPQLITVNKGTKVTWYNDDNAAHTVTNVDFSVDPYNVGTVFDSSLLMPGNTFSHKFDAAGHYPYVCMVHPWMLGFVDVTGSPLPNTQFQPKEITHDVFIVLDWQVGSSPDRIKVYPTVTYDNGIPLPSYSGTVHFSKIYVDNQYEILAKPNQWSNDFYIGYGTFTVYAESPGFLVGSEEFLSSSSNIITIDLQPPTQGVTSTSIDPTIFIILGVIAAIGGGVAVAIMKRKSKPIKPIIPQPIPTTKSDDTMFYGCPRCGNNTKIFYGRQYCPVCKIYL